MDSAQIINLINFNEPGELSDLGSGAGFPGVVLSIYNDNPSFHVKLFEKSPVKRSFLKKFMSENNKFELLGNIYEYNDLSSNYVVCRAFKKLSPIFKISREIKSLKFLSREFHVNSHVNVKCEISHHVPCAPPLSVSRSLALL